LHACVDVKRKKAVFTFFPPLTSSFKILYSKLWFFINYVADA